MNTMEDAIESYINGNGEAARKWLQNSNWSLGDILEVYIYMYEPDNHSIISFVKKMES